MNRDKATRGQELLKKENALLGEAGIDEDTGRDAICDIIHGMIYEGYLLKEEIADMLLCCNVNVSAELEGE